MQEGDVIAEMGLDDQGKKAVIITLYPSRRQQILNMGRLYGISDQLRSNLGAEIIDYKGGTEDLIDDDTQPLIGNKYLRKPMVRDMPYNIRYSVPPSKAIVDWLKVDCSDEEYKSLPDAGPYSLPSKSANKYFESLLPSPPVRQDTPPDSPLSPNKKGGGGRGARR